MVRSKPGRPAGLRGLHVDFPVADVDDDSVFLQCVLDGYFLLSHVVEHGLRLARIRVAIASRARHLPAKNVAAVHGAHELGRRIFFFRGSGIDYGA
jgi:hypothetical protein